MIAPFYSTDILLIKFDILLTSPGAIVFFLLLISKIADKKSNSNKKGTNQIVP